MDISRQYEELVISGRVCVVPVDLLKVKELVILASKLSALVFIEAGKLKSRDNFFPVLITARDAMVHYGRALLLSVGVEVEVENVFLALCVRFPGLELDYTLLESIRGKCEAGDGTVVSYMDWKKVELYIRMFLGVMAEYVEEREWI